MKKYFSLATLLVATLIPLSGCVSARDERAMAMVGIVNHTGNFIYSASLQGDEIPGGGGGGMSAWGAGGANICCTSIPNIWHPGIKVTVYWDMPDGHTHIPKEKIVEVEKYDKPGSIYLHFFPNDEVRVVVSAYPGYSKAHPIPRTPKPANTEITE
jgi:hypothetical protein